MLGHGKGVVELRPVEKSPELDLVNLIKEKDVLGGGTGITGPIKTVKNLKPELPISDMVIKDRR